MSKFSEIKKGLSSLENLERTLHLKQLQINRLLNITQAINDNVSADGLYAMYNSFLSWEMGVKKLALYVKKEQKWICTSHIGLSEEKIKMDISDKFPKYQRLKNIEEDRNHPLIGEFDIVIPVLHKQHAIAYTFIGGFERDDDMYNKVQFITTITNIIAVAIENKRLFKQQLEQERLNREMELASDMQKMLIPSQLPKAADYDLASIYKPHLVVGGDYFDFLELGDGKISFCIADISGKGLAAALLMANFQANFRALIKQHSDALINFIHELNQTVLRITNGEKFITFFVAVYDRQSKELHYINAGHNPPVLVKHDTIYPLNKGCTILGSFQELPSVEESSIKIDGETMILSFTDGLTDVKNEHGDYFEEDMLHDFTKAHYKLSSKAFNDKLLASINRFKGILNFPDDFTVLTCKFLQ